MPLNNAQTMLLFEDTGKMDIWYNTVENFQEEGIEYVDDLEMVDMDFLKQLTDNLICPGGKINGGVTMVKTPDIKFSEKIQMRLESASNILRFYKTAGRAITNTMIQ